MICLRVTSKISSLLLIPCLGCSLLALWVAPTRVTHSVCLWPSLSVDHALNCLTGGYPTIQHNKLRTLFYSEILSDVCADLCTEPTLQPLSGVTLTYATANTEDGCTSGYFGG